LSVIGTVFSVFLLLSLGYGAKKVRLLKAEDADLLNTVVVYMTLPAFIFDAIYSYRKPLPWSIAKAPAAGFATILIVLAIAYLAGKAMNLSRPTLGGLIIASGFGNTGFLGYPVVQAAFQDKAALVTAALYDELAMALPLYTMGALIAASFSGTRVDRAQLVRVLTLPSLIAIPVALVVRQVSIPAPVISAIRYLAAGTVPMVMISLGLSLSGRSLRGMALPVAVTCTLKLAVLPLLTYYAARWAGLSGVVHQSTVLESAMPSAVMTCVIASKFGADAKFVAGVIFLTTLLSIGTIPISIIILGIR